MKQEEFNYMVGKNIRKYRLMYNATNNAKLTQADLAKQIEVSTPLIGALESRKACQGVSAFNLFKISKVLNTSIEKFFETD